MAANRAALPSGLLDDVKNYLNITWTDANTDSKIGGIIAGGIDYLDSLYGAAANYTVDGRPRSLLMDYCRYVRDGALDVFETNYRAQILGMQLEKAVADYAETTVSS